MKDHTEQKIYSYLKEHEEEILEDILTLVKAESPSTDKAAVDACAEVLRALYRKRLGETPEVIPREKSGNCLRLRLGKGEKKLMLLGHFDTVHPLGSLPVLREGGKMYGPGVIDMKGGDVLIIWALKALKELGIPLNKRIAVVHNGDEEIDSPGSREIIMQEARDSCACLLAETGLEGPVRIVTARKGEVKITVRCTGRASHAGSAPQDGINANLELAHQILFLEGLTSPERNTTLSVTLINGGTRYNVVSDRAEAAVCMRYPKKEDREWVREQIEARRPVLPGAEVHIDFRPGFPPMEPTEKTRQLVRLAQEIGEELGFPVGEAPIRGGVSDGNYVADMGIPVLDGLGSSGSGQHSSEEYMVISELIPRGALLAGLIRRI